MELPARNVLIIYTGGTIGMKPTPDGLRPVPQYLGNQLAKMPQFHEPGLPLHTTPISRLGKRITYTIHEWETLLDSSNSTLAKRFSRLFPVPKHTPNFLDL